MATVYCDKDTYVNQVNVNTNYGSNNLVAITYYNSGSVDGLLSFDITGISNSLVTNATLRLYFIGMENLNYELYRLTSDFTESTVAWNTKPAYTLTNKVTKYTPYTYNAWVDIDITALFAAETSNRLGIYLSSLDGDTGGYGINFRSKEYSAAYSAHIIYTISNDYYVKTTGDDTKNGLSWANAWATINKAATTVADGTTVHMEHGEYSQSAVLKVAPQNAGALGIKYKPEPVGGGDTAATVKVTMT